MSLATLTKPVMPSCWIGVITPLITIVLEFFSGACADEFFDPIPTFVHGIILLVVPLANLAALLPIFHNRPGQFKVLAWVNGAAIAISAIYAVLFLPLTPLAMLGILFLGIGLLPLSPLTSLIAALILCRRLRRESAGAATGTDVWKGLGLGLAVLVLSTFPAFMSNYSLNLAASDNTDESTRGVQLFRRWGQEEELLRRCYGRTGRGSGMYTWGRSIGTDGARTLYYRAYGRAFNSVPPP